MPEAFALPGREDQDAGEVVVVPGHFFFAEEAYYLAVGVCVGGGGRGPLDEEVVEEGGDVEEDGFGVEEEFGEEG